MIPLKGFIHYTSSKDTVFFQFRNKLGLSVSSLNTIYIPFLELHVLEKLFTFFEQMQLNSYKKHLNFYAASLSDYLCQYILIVLLGYLTIIRNSKQQHRR